MDSSLPQNTYTKKLRIELQGVAMGFAGMGAYRTAIAEMKRLGDSTAVNAKKNADLSAAAEQKAATLKEKVIREYAKVSQTIQSENLKFEQRMATERLRLEQALQDGRVAAVERANLKMTQLQETYNARMLVLNERLTASNIAAADAGLTGATGANMAAQGRYQSAARTAAMAGAASRIGTIGIGAGLLGLGAGYEFIRAASAKQKFFLQQRALGNFGSLNPADVERYSFQQSMATGAPYQDIATATRFGSDFGFNWPTNKGVVRAATEAALPTGGNISDYAQALGVVLKNFPQYRNNPMAAMNMLLMASKMGRTTPQELVTGQFSRLLTLGGDTGNPDMFPQSLAAVAEMTRLGTPASMSSRLIYQMVSRIMKPTAAMLKFIAWVKKTYGVDLSGDFSAQALQTKGIGGILSDLNAAGLGEKGSLGALTQLFPNIRGLAAAIPLIHNYQDVSNVEQGIKQGAAQDPVGKYYKQYLDLPSTQAQKLQRQFQYLSITMGTALLPAFIQLEKEAIPLVKDFSSFATQNEDVITQLVKLAPELIAVGLAFKAAGGFLRLWNLLKVTEEVKGLTGATLALDGALTAEGGAGMVGALGAVPAKATAAGAAMGTFAAETDAAVGSTAAISGIGGAGVGAGLMRVLGPRLVLGGGILAAVGAIYMLIDAINTYNNTTPKKINWSHPSSNVNVPGWGNVPALPPQAASMPGTKIVTAPNGQRYIVSASWQPPSPSTGYAATMPGSAGGIIPPGSDWGRFGSITHEGPAQGGTGFVGVRGSKYGNPIYAGGAIGSVTDTDYGTGRKSFPVLLPGGRSAAYRYLGGFYDPSAGLVQLWVTPQVTIGGKTYTAGHFAVLHLRSMAKGLSKDKWYPGGTQVGMSGFPPTSGINNSHLCIQADAPARAYFAWAEQNRSLPAAGGASNSGLSLPSGEKSYAGSFAAAGSQHHIDPSVLAGIGVVESSGQVGSGVVSSAGFGSMGVATSNAANKAAGNPAGSPVYGTGAGAQIGGAATELAKKRNWVMSNPKFFKSRQANADTVLRWLGIDPDKMSKTARYNAEVLVIALGLYGSGDLNAAGMKYAYSVLSASMKAQPGHNFPSTYWTGQGQGRVPAGSGGIDSSGYNQNAPKMPTTPAGWSSWWGGKESKTNKVLKEMLQPFTNSDGSINWGAMPKSVRTAVDAAIKQTAYEQYMSERGTLNADIKDPKVRAALMKQAWKQYLQEAKNPEAWYDSTSAAGGIAGRSVPVHVIGRCKAEEHANLHRKAAADHGKKTAHNTATIAGHTGKMVTLMTHLVHDQRLLLHHAKKGPKDSMASHGTKVIPAGPGH